jgi:DNA-directed RNA polymerase specialized sigma subunit
MKERIEHLINVYCDQVFSTDNEAGWHTPSQLDATRYKSNSGSDLLRITKYSARHCAADLHQPNDRADDKIINETQYIRNEHYDFKLAKMLLHKLKDKQLLALLAGIYLQCVYKKKHNKKEIAEYLEITIDALKHNKNKGIKALEEQLKLIEQYEMLKTA